MPTEDQQDRIDDYLRGRSKDPAAFERELESDPQLEQEMNATRLALDAITLGEDRKLKDRLQKLEADRRSGAPEQSAKIVQMRPTRQKSRWLRYVAVAAAVLLLAGYFFLRPADLAGPQLAMESFEPYDNIAYTITKGSNEEARAAAYIAYESGDYATAQREFEALTDKEPADKFYLAQSLLAQEDFGGSLSIFRDLAGLPDFALAPESDYYAALALVGLERNDEARTLLERITTNANHPAYDEAGRLLVRL